MTELEAGLEAVLFAAGDAVPVDRLAAALETSRGALLEAAAALENLYDFENRGIMLLRLEDKLQLCSRPLYADAARRVTESRRPPSLSPAALEVLTIVAYRQPVTRAFIDQLRGVDSGGTVAGLVEKGLIEGGRAHGCARPPDPLPHDRAVPAYVCHQQPERAACPAHAGGERTGAA